MNRKAFLHVNGLLMLLALIGAWYIYHSYQQKTLKENLSAVYRDYKSGVSSLISSPEDKAKMDQALATMETLMNKYGADALNKVGSPNQAQANSGGNQ